MKYMGVKEKVLEDENEIQKFIILLTRACGEPIRGKLKLQKMMFLLSEMHDDVKEESSFDADNYGPYSEIIEQESQYLEEIGVLSSGEGKIFLTNVGNRIAKNMVKNVDRDILLALDEYKDLCNNLTSKELLAYVYSAHPEMTEESLEYKNLKPHMEHYILSILKKHKISAQRAAELLNKSQTHIIKKMRGHKAQL